MLPSGESLAGMDGGKDRQCQRVRYGPTRSDRITGSGVSQL